MSILNLIHAEDAILEGTTKFQQWEQEFNLAWYKPVNDMLITMLLVQLPPQVKEKLRELNPKAMKEVEQQYGGGSYG